jgi:bis(5'-nucleosyl)-tetraphosphatase (symmetrical)
MALYAIGDVQGCYDELMTLLEVIQFNAATDTLWFTGDIVNRGPKSLEMLRFVKGLGEKAVTVLGNHDLHLLAVACGHSKLRKDDTLKSILTADDRDELLLWLRTRPVLHRDADLGIYLLHAGLPPQWTMEQVEQHAMELEDMLRGVRYEKYFQNMYGNKPARWKSSLSGWDRLRFITNCFSRLRYVDTDGRLVLGAKGPMGSQPKQCIPWFQHPARCTKEAVIVFGHWSTLGFYHSDGVIALDSGCLWGGKLTAVRLDNPAGVIEPIQVSCSAARKPNSRNK